VSKTLLASKLLQRAPRPLPTTTVHLTKMSPKSTKVTHRLQRHRRSDRHRIRQSEDSFSFKGTLAKTRTSSSRDSTPYLSSASLQDGSFQQEGDDLKLHDGKSGLGRSGRDNLLKKLFMDLERNEISPPTTSSQEHSHALDFFDDQVMETLLLCR